MATRKKSAYRFFPSAPAEETAGCGDDEFDESDIWGIDSCPADQYRMPIPAPRSSRKKAEKSDRGGAAASLPVNIPDWSKILKEEQRRVGRQFFDYDGGDDDGIGSEPMIPPHELLWRSRAASFSVHEGIGRTLKGRDLSRVRDAIWQTTGFED